MNEGQKKQARKVPFDTRDFVGLVGVVLLGIGFWKIWPPLAFIVPGFVLSGVAIFGVKK